MIRKFQQIWVDDLKILKEERGSFVEDKKKLER